MKTWVVSAIGGAAVLALISGSFWLGGRFATISTPAESLDTGPIDEVVTLVSGRAQPAVAQQPTRIRTCSVDDLARAAELGQFSGVVLDPASGDVLFDRAGDSLSTPASVIKIVTAAAALSTLGPDTRFETKVVSSSEQGRIVLVGGGDATLSTLPEGQESIYLGAPKLQTLAEATVASLKEGLEEGQRLRITEVVLDSSLWDPEDRWDSSWSSDARSKGFISQVTALQVDGDRSDPRVALSRRSDNAVDRAGRAFVDALRRAGNTAGFVRVTTGVAEPGATVLASVSSPPVSELTAYMLKESDNTLAEMLARHVSLAVGLGGSSETLGEAIIAGLSGAGVSAEQIIVQDGSGLSALNQVEPRFIASLLADVYRSNTSLGLVREGLPIAGQDGSLEDRFALANAEAAGSVFAKTGSISGVRSLAGIVNAQDGNALVFAFFSAGEVGDDTRTAIETLVTGVYSCGENLADF